MCFLGNKAHAVLNWMTVSAIDNSQIINSKPGRVPGASAGIHSPWKNTSPQVGYLPFTEEVLLEGASTWLLHHPVIPGPDVLGLGLSKGLGLEGAEIHHSHSPAEILTSLPPLEKNPANKLGSSSPEPGE